MRYSFLGLWVVGVVLTAIVTIASMDISKDEAINRDRKQIEGTWRIVAIEVDGKQTADLDAKKLTMVNGSDGTWSIRSEDQEISKGTSTLDPTKSPKAIDFTPTIGEEKGNHFLGIYELGDNTRKLCFAPPGMDRPTNFATTTGNQFILVIFEREKTN